MERLGKSFFPSTGTVQRNSETTFGSLGHSVPNWVDLEGHTNIGCRIAPINQPTPTGGEQRREAVSISVGTHHIALQAYYPAITDQMRFVVDGQAYNILRAEPDGNHAYTRLKTEIVQALGETLDGSG